MTTARTSEIDRIPSGADTVVRTDPESIESVRAAFEVFEQQSRRLETAYHSLERDLARANRTLQERNRDLTDTVQALRDMSSRLESVIESMTDGLLVIDPRGHVDRCNGAACRILGRERGALEGTPIESLIDDPNLVESLRGVLADVGAVLDRPWSLDGAAGRQVMYSLAPVRVANGDTIGAICNLRDVTDLRHLEKRLQSHERLAALGEMAASVAHEIRNPLGTIEGFARLLKRDLADMPEHLRLADRIVAGTQNLNYVITNLLTYVRPMQLQNEDVAVARVLQVCAETLRDRGGHAGVRVKMPNADADLRVCGDQRQLAQAVLNMGINAIEACERGGAVGFALHAGERTVELTVTDDGCGMTDEQIERVFDPFYTAKEGGTGLGLSLTRKIIDAHGGEIVVESLPGRGTTFKVLLPRLRERETA